MCITARTTTFCAVSQRASLCRTLPNPNWQVSRLTRQKFTKHAVCQLAQSTTDFERAELGNEYFAIDVRPVILFDGVCNLCNGGVNLMLDWDQRGTFRLSALQSPAGRKLLQRAGRSPDDISSIVLVTKDRAYIKSEAVLRIGQQLQMPLALLAGLALLVPKPPADYFYDQVANNRYNLFGYTASCRVSDPRFEERFLLD